MYYFDENHAASFKRPVCQVYIDVVVRPWVTKNHHTIGFLNRIFNFCWHCDTSRVWQSETKNLFHYQSLYYRYYRYTISSTTVLTTAESVLEASSTTSEAAVLERISNENLAI